MAELTQNGHRVLVERGAGVGIGCDDRTYAAAGATLSTTDEVFDEAELIVKVKEPQLDEIVRFRPGQTLLPTRTSPPTQPNGSAQGQWRHRRRL